MGESSATKLFQKRAYDLLSHRYGLLTVICCIALIFVSAFQFGETLLEWSEEKYATVFNSFSDNIAGRSYRKRLCLPVPIDVVYTWVNGSDPAVLYELRKYKEVVEEEVNATKKEQKEGCHFANCVPSKLLVVDPPFPSGLELKTISILYLSFKPIQRLYQMTNPAKANATVTVLQFETFEQLHDALKEDVKILGQNATLRQAYYTTDWTLPNSVLLSDKAMLMGFPESMEADDLRARLPKQYVTQITHIDIFKEKGIAMLTVNNKAELEKIIEDGNITIEGKVQSVETANLIWDLRDYSAGEQIGANRYQDNEELRYSLRSLEQHAPWVRQIFLVTNGQIPAWLNLDNPRLTLVTHDEIYPNKSHLPTFSSPSIESHIHRIPGLSDKFIYMNDDVMFGREVWPDDFYTHSGGQKVYLTWPVPNCADGCPQSWIRDGYCDRACNNSACEWDAGDCEGKSADQPAWGGGDFWGQQDERGYCNSGCANSWLADRYCDQSCNVLQCGFDAGDCGTDSFSRLHQVVLSLAVTIYYLPPGEDQAYFNLTAFLGCEGKMEDGSYDDASVIRAVAIAKKFGVMSVVLHKGHGPTVLNFSISATLAKDETVKMNFTLWVNTNATKVLPQDAKSADKGDGEEIGAVGGEEEDRKDMEDVDKLAGDTHELDRIPFDMLEPKRAYVPPSAAIRQVNLSHYVLPDDIEAKLTELKKQLKEGDLTQKGFDRRHNALWDEFHSRLEAEGRQPEKAGDALAVAGNNLQEPPANEAVIQLKGGPHERDVDINNGLDNGQLNRNAQQFQAFDPQRGNVDANQGIHIAQQDPGRALDTNLGAAQGLDLAQEEIGRALDTNLGAAQGLDLAQEEPGRAQVDEHGVELGGQYAVDDTHKLRRLNGLMPWEKTGLFDDLMQKKEALLAQAEYASPVRQTRDLLDKYSNSLRHVNRLYNAAYGYSARSVPAHMPHMVDKGVMQALQDRFAEEWDETSSHKIRHSRDMQFSFSYFYFLMSEPNQFSAEDVFRAMDTDSSGVLSDRELRTLATRVYDLPLDLEKLNALETKLTNCSRHLPPESVVTPDPQQREEYYEKNMPQVTMQLFVSCGPIVDLVKKNFHAGTKYKYEVMKEDEVTFKMIRTNVSGVVGQLDDIRRDPKKFICLNDDIDHSRQEAQTTKAVLQDFYESLFPVASSFELPREYRNRFLHIDELRQWRYYRDWLKLATQVALLLLIGFTLSSFFSDKIEYFQRRYLGRRSQTRATAEPSTLQAV